MRKLLIVLAVICLVPLSFVLAVLVHHNVVDTSDYNYNHFAASQYHHGTFSGPQVGEPAIDFALYDTDGNRHALSDYRGQYVVIETGSLTCPQYISRIEPMTSLQAAHPEVTFLTLYVREAHPGSKIARHERYEDKTALASRVQLEEPETRTILVDELAGPVHQSYGAWPNMVYIIDPAGEVAFRGMWNDPGVVGDVLQQLQRGASVAGYQTDLDAKFDTTTRVLDRAGGYARLDFWLGVPASAVRHARASAD